MPIEVSYIKIGESKVSQRGSVVLPKAVRLALTLENGEYIEWLTGDHQIFVRKKKKNVYALGVVLPKKSGDIVTVKKKESK